MSNSYSCEYHIKKKKKKKLDLSMLNNREKEKRSLFDLVLMLLDYYN